MICKARGRGNGYGNSGTPQNCKFPFILDGKRYNGCATTDKYGPRCATKVDTKGNLVKWARCNNYCPKDCGKSRFYITLLVNIKLDVHICTPSTNRMLLIETFISIGKDVVCRTRGQKNGCGSCGTTQKCIFPFIHGGKEYSGCSRSSKGKIPFCATKVDSKKNLTKVGLCNQYCSIDPGNY